MLKKLKDKKEELNIQICQLQIELTDIFQTKTYYKTEVENKMQRQNDIFQELKTLERDIVTQDRLAMEFHNKQVSLEWQKNKLIEEKDEVKEQIWKLEKEAIQKIEGEVNGEV